jgi:hypothetical protein
MQAYKHVVDPTRGVKHSEMVATAIKSAERETGQKGWKVWSVDEFVPVAIPQYDEYGNRKKDKYKEVSQIWLRLGLSKHYDIKDDSVESSSI